MIIFVKQFKASVTDAGTLAASPASSAINVWIMAAQPLNVIESARRLYGSDALLIPYIDYSLCVGCGACAELYPAIFVLRDGQAWVSDLDAFTPSMAGDIIRTCIYGAITVEGPGSEGISHKAPSSRGRSGRRGR